jgi:energy-coupling factor transporter ATP-binding protein EcfA2
MKKEKIWEAVKASLMAEGIALDDKEKAVRSLSKCCAARVCIAVYLEFTQ